MPTIVAGQNPPANSNYPRFHVNLGYGRARYNARSGVLSAYRESGYPYAVISTADPSPTVSLPIAVSLGGEYSLSRLVRIGVAFAASAKNSIKGSNWVGGDWRNVPIERFDIEEKTSGSSLFFYVDYVFVPMENYQESRWEVLVGAGAAFSRQKLSGRQLFTYCPSFNSCLLDSSAQYGDHARALGAIVHAALDFYWTTWLSTQARFEFQVMPKLKVKQETLTYGTLYRNTIFDPYQYVVRSRSVQPHSISFSGSTFSLWFRFHF